MDRKLLFTLLAIVVLLLAACGGSKETPEPTEPVAVEEEAAADTAEEPAAEPTEVPAEEPSESTAPEAEPTDAPVEEAAAEVSGEPVEIPVITVGVNAEFEPFVFIDENGNLAGFDIDIMNALSAAANFEMAYATTPFEGIFDGLEKGDFDAAISAITITDARKEIVDFTDPYFESGNAPVSFYNPGQGIAIRTDNTTITGPESLTEGVRVGVKSGTTGAEFAANNTTAELVEFVESQPALDALAAGEVDAVIVDIPVIVGYIKSNPNAGLRVTGGPVTEEAYGIAVSKDKPEVLDMLNAALVKVRGSDQYATLFNTWFGTP